MAVQCGPAPSQLECSRCKTARPFADYSRSKQHRFGLHPYCRACRAEYTRSRYQSDPERFKNYSRWGSTKCRYGLTREQFEAMSAAQGDLCAVCGQPESDPNRTRLTVDHDHKCCPTERTCGQCIRGLVCNTCNRLLGIAGDDPQRLQAAAAYLGG